MTLKEKFENARVAEDTTSFMTEEQKKTDDIMVKIALQIRKARTEKGMSQEQFANFMGVTQAMISRWESGDENFTIEKTVCIMSKLDINFDITFKEKIPINEKYDLEMIRTPKWNTPQGLINFSSYLNAS